MAGTKGDGALLGADETEGEELVEGAALSGKNAAEHILKFK